MAIGIALIVPLALMPDEVSFGPEPDDAPAVRASIPAHDQGAGKTVEQHLHKSMAPQPTVAAAAGLGSWPWIRSAQLENPLEIQFNFQYHESGNLVG